MNSPLTKVSQQDAKLVMAHMYVAFIALGLGGLMGLLQTLVRAGWVTMPTWFSYYQALTVHGVLLALIFTTFFIVGLCFAILSKTLGKFTDQVRLWGWIGFWLMTFGTALAAYYILTNQATVLYTFYVPLQAHPFFYIGLALVIVGSWVAGISMFVHYAKWRKANHKTLSPLYSFMAVSVMVFWLHTTIGVAATVIIQIIPWSMGFADRINVLVSRTLFWYFGHPLVYFWLLPAYAVWYVSIPKIIGGKIFSDSLARLSFFLFMLFSFPVGFHHQLVEPGISEFWKYIQTILTFAVVIPSLMTAFSMFATFEMYGRWKGGRGIFGWFKKLPWGDARFLAPFIGMVAFIPGGAGGIINASYQMNVLVHNTIWIPGHFHLTIATTVILTLFGTTYWLIPHLTGRTLTRSMNRLGIIQTLFWTVGMTIMSTAMHWVGITKGAPRRSSFSTYNDSPQALEWIPYQWAQAIGGSLLFIGIVLMLIIFINLAFFAPRGETEFPVGEVADESEKTPPLLENWKLVIGISIVLVLLAYTLPFIDMLQNAPIGAKGYKFW